MKKIILQEIECVSNVQAGNARIDDCSKLKIIKILFEQILFDDVSFYLKRYFTR